MDISKSLQLLAFLQINPLISDKDFAIFNAYLIYNMNGTLALLIALVSYGNEYLKNGNSVHTLDLNNSTLIYSNTIEFGINHPALKRTAVAKKPKEWFAFLKKDGCKKLKIFFYHSGDESRMKDFESAGFVGGGGQWIIEADYGTYTNYWGYKQNLTKPDSKDKRIWNERFSLIKTEQPTLNLSISIATAKKNLSVSLSKIAAFATKTKSDYWAGIFKKANDNLSSDHPAVGYYKDFVVENQYSLQSEQLLFSASLAYVFGGMGSWNDISYSTPELEKTNTQLSSDLYDRVNEAIIVALNNN